MCKIWEIYKFKQNFLILTISCFLHIIVKSWHIFFMLGLVLNVPSTNKSFSLLNSFINLSSNISIWFVLVDELIYAVFNVTFSFPTLNSKRNGFFFKWLFRASKEMYCFFTSDSLFLFLHLCKVLCIFVYETVFAAFLFLEKKNYNFHYKNVFI